MTEAERLTSAAAAQSVAATAAPLVGALQSLYRAYQKTSIYPAGHPAVPEALAQAASVLRAGGAGNSAPARVTAERSPTLSADAVGQAGLGPPRASPRSECWEGLRQPLQQPQGRAKPLGPTSV